MSDAKKSRADKRTPFRSILGLIGGILLMVFGFVVLNLGGDQLSGGEKALRIVFGIVWFTFSIGMMIYNVLNLNAQKRAKKDQQAG